VILVHVGVTVITYRRPALLAALLRSLAVQQPIPGTTVSLIVVDNDDAGSARAVIGSFRSTLPWPCTYAIEPRRNIAAARNRAVAAALAGGADHVAFIDDDERADPGWLAALLRVQHETGADAVTGPVIPILHGEAPSWAAAALFTPMPRLQTGATVRTAATSNALVSARLLRALDGPFDEEFGVSGGSDSALFLRITQMGARIVWANDAITEETIGPRRTTISWVARRAFRIGNVGVFIERRVLHRWLARRVAKTCAHVAVGAAMVPLALVRGPATLVAALREICLGCGAMAALAGYRYLEYRVLRGE
jgi:succinoglycan biosynthesis protein ExoM